MQGGTAQNQSYTASNRSYITTQASATQADEGTDQGAPPPAEENEQTPDPAAQQYDDQGGQAQNVMVIPLPLYGNVNNLGPATRETIEQAPYPQGNGTTSSIPIPSGSTNNTVGLTNPPEIPRPIYYPTPPGGNNVRVVVPNPPLVGGPSVFTAPRPGH